MGTTLVRPQFNIYIVVFGALNHTNLGRFELLCIISTDKHLFLHLATLFWFKEPVLEYGVIILLL